MIPPVLPPPQPWSIRDTGSAFQVSDRHGRVLAHFYYQSELVLRSDYVTRRVARELTITFASMHKSR